MKRTTNYALPTWEKSDFIQMSDFNDLTHKLDTALKGHDDTLNTKADTSAVTAVQQEVAAAREAARDHGGQRRDGIRPLAGRHVQSCRAVFHVLRGVKQRLNDNRDKWHFVRYCLQQ